MKRQLMAVLAIGLLINSPGRGSAAEPKLEQVRAIAEIQKLGGRLTIDEKNPDKPVISVELNTTNATDAELEHLKILTHCGNSTLITPSLPAPA